MLPAQATPKTTCPYRLFIMHLYQPWRKPHMTLRRQSWIETNGIHGAAISFINASCQTFITSIRSICSYTNNNVVLMAGHFCCCTIERRCPSCIEFSISVNWRMATTINVNLCTLLCYCTLRKRFWKVSNEK